MHAVVVFYSFDPETCVYLFDDYKKACDYLEAMWQHCYNCELADESNIDEDGTYHEENYAQIKWGDEDNALRIRIWQVVPTSEPLKTDGKDWK